MKSIMQRLVLVLLAVDVISGIAVDYNNGLNQDGYNWENFKNKEGNVTDRHTLLQLYALMCPVPVPCGATNYYGLELHATDDPYDKLYKSCKECSCRDDCLTRENCCPDLTAAFMEHECVDTALYRSPILIDKSPDIEDVHIVRTDPEEDDPANDALGGAATEIFYTSNSWNLMVTSCPPDATDEQVVYCSAGKTVPVSSNSSQISYRNVHCAACNHDDGDLVNWKVTFVCNEEMEEVAFGSRGFKANMKASESKIT